MTIIHNVTKSFGKTMALKGLDLHIQQGEFIAIVGPSGCGKTTLLRLLAGFMEPTAGTIEMDGQIVAGDGQFIPPEKRNVGLVFQNFALWPHMTVREQIAFPLKHHRFTPSHIKQNIELRMNEMLTLVGLSELGHRMPHELSGGQKQRVAIARALAAEPSLLLMDEPLSSLDAKLRVELRNEIQTIHRTFRPSIVYVTHDQSEALAMADRIVVMNNGLIEQQDTPVQIYNHPKTPFVATFIGKSNLITGVWDRDIFHPFGNDQIQWVLPGMDLTFKKESRCPVRPEQLQLSKTGKGLEGEIKNVLFQGREIHYTLLVHDQLIDVITPIHTSFAVGERVNVMFTP